MSAKSVNDQSVTDDQELAKVLAGNASEQKSNVNDALSGLQFEESPVPVQTRNASSAGTSAASGGATPAITPSPSAAAASATKGATAQPTAAQSAQGAAPQAAQKSNTVIDASSAPASAPAASAPAVQGASGDSSLDSLKRDALEQLRPLVGKLNLPAEEKFDTLLLIIRSTDDQSLLAPAHEAAKAIPDEARRAQALLDVIKEIDYFSAGQN